MTHTTGLVRQGDVLLIPRSPLTRAERAKATAVHRDNGRVVLAYGEVTGHAHAILDDAATLYELMGGTRVLDAAPGTALVHEEHSTLTLGGTYTVVRQRTYTPEAIRNVAD